ncbi:hypothetical protein C8R44DRAFT_355390 [Mycena epipterygia]|nr:hypothetical protein C8R44DRAFT_355390 [Mycena epipterygia]
MRGCHCVHNNALSPTSSPHVAHILPKYGIPHCSRSCADRCRQHLCTICVSLPVFALLHSNANDTRPGSSHVPSAFCVLCVYPSSLCPRPATQSPMSSLQEDLCSCLSPSLYHPADSFRRMI